ncbi:MAG: hypothetical protein QNJ14_00465 [Woeseiaceae bacterium]|nr:hypothetical protein [Woeseiaceae bacterium]
MLTIIGLIVVGVVVDYFFVAVFRGLKRAKFTVTEDSPSNYSFLTDVGGYRIDRQARTLSYAISGKRSVVSLDDLKRLKYGYLDKSAFMAEVFFGFDLTDFFGPYQDINHWYEIHLETVSGEKIPLFTAGQYQPREFLLTWYITLQQSILEKMGFFHDVHEYSHRVLDEIKNAFRESNCDMKYH